MPHPQGKQSTIRQSLVAYLQQETATYFPNMDWEYYFIDKGYVEEPTGAVYITQIQRKDNYPANLSHVPKVYTIQVSLKLFDSDYKLALDKAADWEEEICDRIIKKLQIDGHNGLFKGIHPSPKQPSIIQENKNQDDGGYIAVHMFFIWNDDGAIESSLQIDDLLLD